MEHTSEIEWPGDVQERFLKYQTISEPNASEVIIN
jgi:hypothetical protein